MKRALLILILSACGPLSPEDFGLPPGPLSGPDSSGTGDVSCEILPGEAHGPCVEEVCGDGLLCLPALGKKASVCVPFCDETCGVDLCLETGPFSCNPAGLCTLSCKGEEDTESCLLGQVCAKGGDTAPWECFWSEG